jgi:hypothetical protein
LLGLLDAREGGIPFVLDLTRDPPRLNDLGAFRIAA